MNQSEMISEIEALLKKLKGQTIKKNGDTAHKQAIQELLVHYNTINILPKETPNLAVVKKYGILIEQFLTEGNFFKKAFKSPKHELLYHMFCTLNLHFLFIYYRYRALPFPKSQLIIHIKSLVILITRLYKKLQLLFAQDGQLTNSFTQILKEINIFKAKSQLFSKINELLEIELKVNKSLYNKLRRFYNLNPVNIQKGEVTIDGQKNEYYKLQLKKLMDGISIGEIKERFFDILVEFEGELCVLNFKLTEESHDLFGEFNRSILEENFNTNKTFINLLDKIDPDNPAKNDKKDETATCFVPLPIKTFLQNSIGIMNTVESPSVGSSILEDAETENKGKDYRKERKVSLSGLDKIKINTNKKNMKDTHVIFKQMTPELYRKLNEEALFNAFYSGVSNYKQYLASHELERRDWCLHKKDKLWYKELELVENNKFYKKGSFMYFDVAKTFSIQIANEKTIYNNEIISIK